MNKIIITVEGGIVQSVDGNIDAEVLIMDFDKHADEKLSLSYHETQLLNFPEVLFNALISVHKYRPEEIKSVLNFFRKNMMQVLD